MGKSALGVIFGNRGFFPDQLVGAARKDLEKVFSELHVDAVMLSEQDTKLGGVETYSDARMCADLFKRERERIAGVVVVLPNFGDERAVADTLKLAGLNVPVLIQACADEADKMGVTHRRDAFCGKISVCNNLKQYGIPFSLTDKHTMAIDSQDFRNELKNFAAVCRTVEGLRTARLGAVGARPTAFNTVRYSEKLFQQSGMSVVTLDLSELFAMADRIEKSDQRIPTKAGEIKGYASTGLLPEDKLKRISAVALALDDWMKDNELQASAIQCWTSVQENLGISVCTIMSLMSENLLPSACEVDIPGVVSMYALQLASASPSALVDWNNNYGENLDKCVLFHCGNWAKTFAPDLSVVPHEIIGGIFGEDKTWGAMDGRTPQGPMSYARITTDDFNGTIKAYVGEGRFTDDALETFGTRAVCEIPQMQDLMKYICKNGFEHHAAISRSHCAGSVVEALETYMDWDVYRHS